MSKTEKFYDEEIAPILKDLAEKCVDNGLNFIAVVEYDKGKIGRTCFMKNECLEMTMINHCAKTVPNVDAYIIGLKRYAKNNNIDTSASWYLTEH